MKVKIGFVSQSLTGVDYHRLLKPMQLLNSDHEFEVIRCDGASEEMYDHNFDVIVFNRLLPIIKQEEFIKELKRRGTYVICDMDDHWILNYGHMGKRISDTYKRQTLEALINSNEIWVTHDHLGKAVEPLNCNWHVMTNAIDPEESQWRPKESHETRIGWAGGATHFKDLMLTDGCWGETIPIVCGYNEKEKEWVRLAEHLKANYVNCLPVLTYGYLYEQFDIAIAPLVNNKFNTYKSNLKILEAGIKGLPIFVQDIHPYTDETQGVYKVRDWKEALSIASKMDAQEIRENGRQLRNYIIKNYNLRDINEKRKERLR